MNTLTTLTRYAITHPGHTARYALDRLTRAHRPRYGTDPTTMQAAIECTHCRFILTRTYPHGMTPADLLPMLTRYCQLHEAHRKGRP